MFANLKSKKKGSIVVYILVFTKTTKKNTKIGIIKNIFKLGYFKLLVEITLLND